MPATAESQAVEPLWVIKARACAARRKAEREQRDFLESGEYAALALMPKTNDCVKLMHVFKKPRALIP